MIQQYYYASVIDPRTNKKTLLKGPYLTYKEAEQNICDAKRQAFKRDDRSHFYAFGTAGSHLKLETLFGA